MPKHAAGGRVLYQERQWPSLGILLFGLLPLPLVGVVICAVIANHGSRGAWTSVFPWFVGSGVFNALMFWGIQVARRMQVRENVLQMGREAIPYGDIQDARFVHDAEAALVLDRMTGSARRRGGFVLSMNEWNRIHGSWRQPWMHDAIYVELKPGARAVTDKWLIGTRHPQELMRLIEDGMARAQAPASAVEASPV
jgi:hypothetical protein